MPDFILLVDDDPITNFLNERLLHRTAPGREVLVATNGQRGLELLDQHYHAGSPGSPALVLLDLNMPVMNGQEFLEKLAARPPAPHTPVVVVLTSSQLDRDLARLRHLPVAAFLTKPLTTDNITAILARHFPAAPPAA